MSSLNTKDIITYQSVGKLLIASLRQEFQTLIAANAEPTLWSQDELVHRATQMIVETDLLNPATDYMYETDIKTTAAKTAKGLYREITAEKSKADLSVVPDSELLKLIEVKMKSIQEDKKAVREANQKNKVRSLSKEELAKYLPVKLSDVDAKAFTKEIDNKAKRKV